MMFSDLVRLIDGLLNMNPMALFALLPFSLILWFGWKLLNAYVLNGHWLILAGVGLLTFAVVSTLLKDGNAMGALAFSAILCFIGHEAYRRLIQSR